MATPTRFNKVGFSGRQGAENNSLDSFLQTFEFPVTAQGVDTPIDTGVKTPLKAMQVVSAYIVVNTPESTAAAKTVSVGVTNQDAVILADVDVENAGAAGTPVTEAITLTEPNEFTQGDTFTYTFVDTDFAELEAVCVVTVLAIN